MITLAYVALFVAGLVLIEKGADLFTDKVGDIVEETGASETVVGLLTVGMEWEELVVAAVAAASGSVGIAVGNVVGANIANLTGSFSLGLLAAPVEIRRDDRVFSAVLVVVTVVVSSLMYLGTVTRPIGAALLILFAGYLGVLLYLMHRGKLDLRFEREDDNDDDDGSDSPSRQVSSS